MEARNIDVQHNVTLPGKFLNHQVDVYWKFESGGIEYSTVVECKDWNRPLEQEKLLAFKSKLEDLNNPTGVIVTRSGYQSGALKYAHAHGIYLYELFEEPPLVMKEGTFGRMKVTPYLINDQSQEIELVLNGSSMNHIMLITDSMWIVIGLKFSLESLRMRSYRR
jgi:hypothetical protein